MPEYRLEFPQEFLEREFEYTAKGYASGVRICADHGCADITFYDPTRLSQDIDDEVPGDGYFACANLVVVPEVTREAITRAVASLEAGGFVELVFRDQGEA